jgi:hypothetical protein
MNAPSEVPLNTTVPELAAPQSLIHWLKAIADETSILDAFESEAQTGADWYPPFLRESDWQEFCLAAHEHWRVQSHVIVRGLPVLCDGAASIPAALCLSRRFKSYNNGKVVRIFRMSPWSKSLSHTIKAGDFHTDLNTAPTPPAVTGIHCLEADPGGPTFGENRVVLYSHLYAELQRRGDEESLRFLLDTEVPALNNSGDSFWRGRLVQDGTIRYHPATIRSALRQERLDETLAERVFHSVHIAALAVSNPIALASGDLLFVSNRRALHYRGECTVQFEHYPMVFKSRRIAVLHLLDEYLEHEND